MDLGDMNGLKKGLKGFNGIKRDLKDLQGFKEIYMCLKDLS